MARRFGTVSCVWSLLASGAIASEPRPVVVWIQTDPWAMVLGADTPRVAVYDDGEAVFLATDGGEAVYRHVRLDAPALAAVRAHVAPLLAVGGLRARYDLAPNVTDQPETLLYVADGRREAVTRVYGLMAAGTQLPAFTRFPGGPAPDVLPREVAALHAWLARFGAPASQAWTPRTIEVMLWDYSHAPEASIAWPKDWPGLTSERARRRGASWSVFLDGSELARLKAFLATRNPRGAVELEGRKLSAAYRFVFPAERVWHDAFRAALTRAGERTATADP